MPLHTDMVGQTTAAMSHHVDARWLMAYAAGLGDFNARYLDTQAGTVCAHPLFPVCLEWPAILASRDLAGAQSLTADERARAVHAAHDLHVFRAIRAGERLHTRATVAAIRQIKPGAAMTTRLDTTDDTGALVCRTYQLTISRGVAVAGEPGGRSIETAPAVPVAPEHRHDPMHLTLAAPEGLAHIYTECARIWNPIHTDRGVALAAGLPDIILHGTATLALAVSQLVDHGLDGAPGRVVRIGGRFAAMVLMPSTLTLALHADHDRTLFFSVQNPDGASAVSGGFLQYR